MREYQEILFAYDVILRVKRYIFETLVPIEIHFTNHDDAMKFNIHAMSTIFDVSMQRRKKHPSFIQENNFASNGPVRVNPF